MDEVIPLTQSQVALVDAATLVRLSQGLFAIVDIADVPVVESFFWTAQKIGANWYAVRNTHTNGTRDYIYMHRELMRAPSEYEVDHRNHITLDNRRSNLRLSTRSQQEANKPKRCKAGAAPQSMYKGVGNDPRPSHANKPWYARTVCGGQRYWLGYFAEEIDAAKMYDTKALELFGEFAFLNFPREQPAA